MRLQLIRNATLRLSFGRTTILVDPYLAPKHSLRSFTGRSPNPTVELPMAIDAIIDGVDFAIVSHLHSDHFDGVAHDRLPKALPIVCQPGDEAAIRAKGFTDVTPLAVSLEIAGATLTRREASHGLGQVTKIMGSVMGFSLTAPGEPSLYWTGDTVLYPPVLETIRDTRPNLIVTHSCGALWDGDLIVMDEAQTIAVCEAAPQATVVATHMEALDHATVDRKRLRAAAEARGIGPERLAIPADGETLSFGR